MPKKAIVEINAQIETEIDPVKMGTDNEEEAVIVLRAATNAAFRSIFGESANVQVTISTEEEEEKSDEDTTVDIKG